MNRYDKHQLTEACIVLFIIVIAVWSIFLAWKYHQNFIDKCVSSGGVPVNMHCINPGSVIEVD